MLRERTLAASRSRRATCAATRGVIFTVTSIRVPSGLYAPPGRHDAFPASRLYNIYTVMQITNKRESSALSLQGSKIKMLNSDAVRRTEGK
jgi:hypothetical protein